MLYKSVLKPIFFQFDPELVHDFMTNVGRFLGNFALTRKLTNIVYGYHGPDISKTVDGITYRTPFLLSAGFDYNGHLGRILPEIGLGGEEVGSVTAKPCEGNPKPRSTRLPKSRSIIVNKGLRNDGVEVIIKRLRGLTSQDSYRGPSFAPAELPLSPRLQRTSRKGKPTSVIPFITGISIARTNCAESSDIEAGIQDYLYSFKRLNEENVGDYYTINISCPNAFGGEAFTSPALLERLLTALDAVVCKKPVYVKMPINIPWTQFAELLKIIDKHGLEGVVIGNLNKDYNSLDVRSEAPAEYRGGLSGKPCFRLSNELIRQTRALYGSRFTIIGVGGVMSVENAREKFTAGADLIQLITGIIYEGPGLIRKLCADVAEVRPRYRGCTSAE